MGRREGLLYKRRPHDAVSQFKWQFDYVSTECLCRKHTMKTTETRAKTTIVTRKDGEDGMFLTLVHLHHMKQTNRSYSFSTSSGLLGTKEQYTSPELSDPRPILIVSCAPDKTQWTGKTDWKRYSIEQCESGSQTHDYSDCWRQSDTLTQQCIPPVNSCPSHPCTFGSIYFVDTARFCSFPCPCTCRCFCGGVQTSSIQKGEGEGEREREDPFSNCSRNRIACTVAGYRVRCGLRIARSAAGKASFKTRISRISGLACSPTPARSSCPRRSTRSLCATWYTLPEPTTSTCDGLSSDASPCVPVLVPNVECC